MKSRRNSSIEQLLDRQGRLWESQQHPTTPKTDRLRGNLTVSAQPYAGVRELAQQVAEISGWEVFDRQILEALHEDETLGRKVVDSLDEHLLNYREDLLYQMFVPNHVSSTGYLHRLSQLVLSLAMRGQLILVGRGASFIVPQERRLAVLVVRSFESRLERKQELEKGTSRARARNELLRIDRERGEFVRRGFHRDVNDPQGYDVCVNLDTIPLEAAACLVLEALRLRFPNDFPAATTPP